MIKSRMHHNNYSSLTSIQLSEIVQKVRILSVCLILYVLPVPVWGFMQRCTPDPALVQPMAACYYTPLLKNLARSLWVSRKQQLLASWRVSCRVIFACYHSSKVYYVSCVVTPPGLCQLLSILDDLLILFIGIIMNIGSFFIRNSYPASYWQVCAQSLLALIAMQLALKKMQCFYCLLCFLLVSASVSSSATSCNNLTSLVEALLMITCCSWLKYSILFVAHQPYMLQ